MASIAAISTLRKESENAQGVNAKCESYHHCTAANHSPELVHVVASAGHSFRYALIWLARSRESDNGFRAPAVWTDEPEHLSTVTEKRETVAHCACMNGASKTHLHGSPAFDLVQSRRKPVGDGERNGNDDC
jgi:hypothetical protein